MPFLRPLAAFKHITDINPDFFLDKGISALFLDVDNTLTTHDNPVPHEKIEEWIENAKQSGLKLIILSNNYDERVAPFANLLDLDYIPRARKPLTFGLTRGMKKYNLSRGQVALVGDQIFTDIIGGNLKGVFTVLVEPYEFETGWFFKVKRKLEIPILKRIKYED